MASLADWLDDRTGYRNCLAARRDRQIPGGASWGKAIGPCAVMLGFVEVITGLFLMSSFAPSATAAWASVYYIDSVPFGVFLRGIHFWTAQSLVVVVALYILRGLLTANYRPPLEIAWIAALVVLPTVVVWSLTGGLMLGTQTARGQIEVETNIVGSLPLVGAPLKTLILGGDQIGHLANIHFYMLHVAVFPIFVAALVCVIYWQSRRSQSAKFEIATSATADSSETKRQRYHPFQSVRNWIVFSVILTAIVLAAWFHPPLLDMPADPSFEHIARPEWYFSFLYQLRHYFTGPNEAVLTMAVPGVLFVVLLLAPFIDRNPTSRVAAIFRFVLALICVGGWSVLTWLAFAADRSDGEFVASRNQQLEWSDRSRILADYQSIPPEGPTALLRSDARTQGPRLFRQHCASCHAYADVKNPDAPANIASCDASAPNLFQFATRKWLSGFLDIDAIQSEQYFGNTAFADGEMVEWVRENIAEMQEDMDDDERAEFQSEIQDAVAALSAEAGLTSQEKLDAESTQQIERGRIAIDETFSCTECHKFHDSGDLGSAPDLTGYGSRDWLIGIIQDPAHERFYRDSNDRMPAFAPAGEPKPKLDSKSIELIADWLRGEWFEPRKPESPESR